MRFSEIYERLIAYWPERISVADGSAISSGGKHKASPSTTPGGGWLFPALSKVSSEIEDRIDHSEDTWGSLMAWTMFEVFHGEAMKLREIGSEILHPRTVNRKVIEEKYYENLHGKDWAEELGAYSRS